MESAREWVRKEEKMRHERADTGRRMRGLAGVEKKVTEVERKSGVFSVPDKLRQARVRQGGGREWSFGLFKPRRGHVTGSLTSAPWIWWYRGCR